MFMQTSHTYIIHQFQEICITYACIYQVCIDANHQTSVITKGNTTNSMPAISGTDVRVHSHQRWLTCSVRSFPYSDHSTASIWFGEWDVSRELLPEGLTTFVHIRSRQHTLHGSYITEQVYGASTIARGTLTPIPYVDVLDWVSVLKVC